MNVGIIGLGSMGRRRIRLLKEIGSIDSIYGIDLNEDRRLQATNELNVMCFKSLDDLIKETKIDCVVISSPPLSHNKIIDECLEKDLHVFTEINLVTNGYSENIQKALTKSKTLFLSSTFLYRNEISFIQEEIKEKKVNYIYHVGQYLPDWHPWENISDFFVGDKRTNGCREIFAIDLPWILETFGKVEKIYCEKRKSSSLIIDYPDTYNVIIRHENGTLGTIIVDVISRDAERNLEIYGEDLHLFWEGNPDSLFKFNFETRVKEKISTYEKVDQNEFYANNIIENAYKEELLNFLNCINGTEEPRYSFEKDFYTLSIIDQIEK